MTLAWTGGGTLQWAINAAGPWNDLATATSPHPVTFNDKPVQFFRITK